MVCWSIAVIVFILLLAASPVEAKGRDYYKILVMRSAPFGSYVDAGAYLSCAYGNGAELQWSCRV